jgi:hypothetical protein
MKRNPFSIRRIILIFLLCLVSSSIMAQKTNLDTLNFKQLNQYMVKAFKMRNAGMILTFGGVGIVAAGYITSAIMMGQPKKPDEYMEDVIPFVLGICVGIPIAIVGIPFWVIGGIKNAKAEIALRKFDFKTNNSMAVGIGITIRF